MGGRLLQPELMDDPALPAQEHARALAGLARLNRLSGAPETMLKMVASQVKDGSEGSGRTLSVLDVATGSGDIPVALARWKREAGIGGEVMVCDASRVALDAASARAREAGVEISVLERDLVAAGLQQSDSSVDVVTCSLFLHHLKEEHVVGLLSEMGRVARRAVIVSDLRRCATGMVAATVASRVVTRSRVVHVDAVRSVRAAFTETELREMARRAGLAQARISRIWPFRMLLVWERP